MKRFQTILTAMIFLLIQAVETDAQVIKNPAGPSSPAVLMIEDFDTLDEWEDLHFPKIPRHSTFEIVDHQAGKALELRSDGSASGKLRREGFDPYMFPWLSWRWKIEAFPHDEDPTKKIGDDYPVRIYVLFEYDPANPGSAGRFKYELAKLLYGAYPPHSSLNFVWANRRAAEDYYPNPFTDRAAMIVRDRGSAAAGEWREHEVDIIAEYRKAFGQDPPRRATIAVMADTDNTGTRSRAWIDYIRAGSR
jgi:hypothetical protein